MKPPVFIVDGSDVGMYQDAHVAQGWLEAPDVRDGVLEIFDADGSHLDASAESDDAPVVILDSLTRAPEPERLRRILRDYIGAVRSAKPELVGMSEQSLSKAQLPDLVTEMQAIDVRHRSRSMGARLGGWTAKRLGSPEES